ncbi:MAG: M20/M25/M40 family metallo-hydrolase [Bacilli bacterium]|nr:M20/M25/M40 family metallo-hydrolase [Bacilli bacterium]
MKTYKIYSFIIASSTLFALTSCNKSIDTNKITDEAINQFIELTKVPRPSYHLDKIRKYLNSYAQEHSFEHQVDDYGNFWMDIPATSGYQDKPKIILQAHMDMVCVGEDGEGAGYTEEYFINNPINAIINYDNTITASKTSLGADDGIGIAIIMAIINSDAPHGPIRALITADEEVGLIGAGYLPDNVLDSDYLINIDDDVSNEIIYSTAGSLRMTHLKTCGVSTIPNEYTGVSIHISGLLGGHSGDDIQKHRLSAAVVTSKIFKEIEKEGITYVLGNINGGTATNSIAPYADISFAVLSSEVSTTKNIIDTVKNELMNEYPDEKNFVIKYNGVAITKYLNSNDSKDYIDLLASFPQGVISMKTKDLPQTSSNIGLFSIRGGKCSISTSSRSCVNDDLEMLRKNTFIPNDTNKGYNYTIDSYYPGWDGDPKTDLINYLKEGLALSYKEETKLVATHSGLECAWFASKRDGIKLASIGPRIDNPHTTSETLYIETVKPVIETVLYTLKNIK